MRRSPRVLLAWAAAVVVMLLTVQVVASDLGSLHRRARSLGADVAIVLAARDLPLGVTLSAADLRVVRRPASTSTPDAVRDPALAIGRVVAVALLRDDVVGARHLVTRTGGIVPEGKRAVHVVVTDGFQPPQGSVVDVLATYDPALGSDAGPTTAVEPGRATVVARGAHVLTAAAEPGDRAGSGVTLVVTEAEARAVAYAASVGEVALALAPAQSACCSAPAP
jgi:Flp pilus assembly protein CpaB